MDIERFIKKIRDIKEAAPTNSSGADGFSSTATASGPVAGYDKRLFTPTDDLLSQDYQTPGESGLSLYRFSDVYPVEKATELDVDDMVDASKKYDKLVDEQRFGRRNYMQDKLQKVIDTIRSLTMRVVVILQDYHLINHQLKRKKSISMVVMDQEKCGWLIRNNKYIGSINT